MTPEPEARVEGPKREIGEAIGEASMCWNETPKWVFDSSRASAIVERLAKLLVEARHSAIEDAAKVADYFVEYHKAGPDGDVNKYQLLTSERIAEAIRQLKTDGGSK